MSDRSEIDDPTLVPVFVVADGQRASTGSVDAEGVTLDIDPLSPGIAELVELAVSATLAVGSRTARVASRPIRRAGSMLDRVARSQAGRAAMRAMAGILDDPAEKGRHELAVAGRVVEERLGRLVGLVVPVIIESLDVELVLDRLDLDDVIARVDIDEMLRRVDVDAFLASVDVDALLGRVDVNALLDRVDVDRLMARVDVDALLARVDVDALMKRVDVDGLMERTQMGDIIARSTGQVADSALDLARRQAVGLDTVLMRVVDRTMGRDPDYGPKGPVGLEDREPEATT